MQNSTEKQTKEINFDDFKIGDKIKMIGNHIEKGKPVIIKATVSGIHDNSIDLKNLYSLNSQKNERKEDSGSLSKQEIAERKISITQDKYPEQKFDYSELKFPMLGKSKEEIGNTNIAKLLSGESTDIIEGLQKKNKENEKQQLAPAKLALKRNDNGSISLNIMEKAEKLIIGKDNSGIIMGVELNQEQKNMLEKIGHAGLVKNLKAGDGSEFSAYVSVDKELNTLKFMSKESIKIADSLKGAQLTEKQKTSLEAGKPTLVKDMEAKDGTKFSAYVVIDAAKKNMSFHASDDKLMKELSQDQEEKKTKSKSKGI